MIQGQIQHLSDIQVKDKNFVHPVKIIEISEKQILDIFDQIREFPLRKFTKRKENAKTFASF